MAVQLGLIFAASGGAAAQEYPVKPTRLIVPYAAGGNADIQARIFGQKLTEAYGQQVVIDNRAGANGVIGTELVAKAPPDGYNLAFVASGHAINPGMYAKLPFDPSRDFAAVARVSAAPNLVAITNALPVKTVKQLVALARSRPGQMSFASAGNGSPGHLSGALLNTLAGIDIVHVPYKATAQALTDLMSGQVQVMYPTLTSVMPHVKAGKLRALAVTTRSRSALAPDLPTMIESGIPGYETTQWNGFLAPAATPAAIVTRLNGTLAKSAQAPDVRERLAALGVEPFPSSPDEFSRFIAAEIVKWGEIIKASGAKVE
ncbi:MAG TPA: tripartite tricarboxylate transporter substrate binding protein [Burkholderiales bacterium]|nr:tripartite tricarboxylate transporter substrate binding protein [Burkholderiales bacterium]